MSKSIQENERMGEQELQAQASRIKYLIASIMACLLGLKTVQIT